jgi:hypothetical protein
LQTETQKKKMLQAINQITFWPLRKKHFISFPKPFLCVERNLLINQHALPDLPGDVL